MMSEPLIVADLKVMMGKPVISGTRITVDLIREKRGSGESIGMPSSPLPNVRPALRTTTSWDKRTIVVLCC